MGAKMTSYSCASPELDWNRYYDVEARTRRFLPELDPAEAERCAFAESLLPAGPLGRVLELGSGDGHLASRLARRPGTRVVCLDLVPDRAARSSRLSGAPALSAFASHLPFRSGSFDLITLVEVLEHLPDIATVLRGIRRIGRGGELIVTVPFEQKIPQVICPHCLGNFPIDGHLHSFSEATLRDLLSTHGLPPRRMAIHRPEPPRRWESLLPFRALGSRGRATLKSSLRRAGILDLPPGRYLGAAAPLPSH
ncbi:MAG: hypothetical protein CME06_00560 [Gemmatimonadetes bacterium]|nr:hypothetical protein [Gemmatimonadota bacterium]